VVVGQWENVLLFFKKKNNFDKKKMTTNEQRKECVTKEEEEVSFPNLFQFFREELLLLLYLSMLQKFN
jgi:hypothetical protein